MRTILSIYTQWIRRPSVPHLALLLIHCMRKLDRIFFHGPGGWLDPTRTKYEHLEDEVLIRIRGATLSFSRDVGSPYTVKLEGGRTTGFRTIFIGSFKDPILIEQLPSFLERGRKYLTQQHSPSGGRWELGWHLAGLENDSLSEGSPSVPKKA
jgi:hypothetical protein